MSKVNALATKRLELAKKGVTLPKLDKLDPALRIPKSIRMDEWSNASTGFGTSSYHAVTNSTFQAVPRIDRYQQEQMYRSDWVTRKGIDAPAEDMTRKGISYQHNDDDTEKDKKDKPKGDQEKSQKQIDDFDKLLTTEYNMWETAFQMLALAGASGGSLTLFNFDDISTPEEFKLPLNENAVSEIKWIKTIPAWFAIPITYYRDINHPKWGQPEHYQVVIREAGFGITLDVHETRMIRMDGRFTTQTARVQNRGWNDSAIQAVYTALRDYGVCVVSSNSNMESFTYDQLGVKGLSELVMNNETDVILDRIYLQHSLLHSSKLGLYDADSEAMDRKGTPVTGLADLWDRYTEAICGAWGIPRSRFFSSEAGALGGNAAESDTRNYFNRIGSEQELKLRPWINSFMETVNLAVKMIGEIPDYTFNELHEQSDKEKAETRLIQAQTDQIYIQENVLSPEEVTISRFSKSETDLETNMVDFEARDEMQEVEMSPEEADALLAENENLKFQNAVKEESDRQQAFNKPEEKKDSNPITLEVKPEIKVDAPTINVEIPEQKDHSGEIESIKAEVKEGLTEIKDKLNEDQEIEIGD